ncbi:hypothetical protein [Neobacillus sp. PS2-9]|uniref:tetratricopeptide repeat protein n=1 Tax=Neobacillus sp. PS2-9 TaxID=3070676 RepID=UPI0027E21346|nr:hypothetical protein [Neobacillus sp. PS2-9]WML58108.1 hypothetical protein RCG25_25160 [Neobacillus sp. PS2-9]
MSNLQQQKQQANSLRKQGLLKEALPIYHELWKTTTKDKFDAAGYLHCLRKLNMNEEALSLVKECEKDYSDFNWCRNEIIWTYIGSLKMMNETASIGSVLPIANKIMKLNPDELPKNTTVLFVLKKAKQFKKWDIATLWVDRINPDTLDKEPITLSKGTTGWSNFLIWHHHKVRCLIHQKKYQEAIEMVNSIINKANQEKKFFQCLAAQAYEQMGKSDKAIQVLTDLSKHKKVDWWIVHQLANVLKNKGEKEKALKKMYQAATLSYRLESIVTLLHDIALICKELNRLEESYYHLLLLKLIREKKEWVVKGDVEQLIKETGNYLNLTNMMNYKDVLHQCRTYWNTIAASDNKKTIEGNSKRESKNALNGTLIQVKDEKPFCFIKTPDESFFCYKSDIKGEAKEGLKVKFDAIPSFDKKKQQESWKAINIVLM